MKSITYLGFPPVENRDMRSITGRCHVADSTLSVVRYCVSRMAGQRAGFLKMPKHYRRYAIAAAIQHHKENRVQYRQVMSNYRGEFVPTYFYDWATFEVLIAPPVIASDLAAMATA